MFRYEYYNDIFFTDNTEKIIIDNTNENNTTLKDIEYIKIKNNKGDEIIFEVFFLKNTGLKPKIAFHVDSFIVGVDYGVEFINEFLKISTTIHSNYIFCGFLFYHEKTILVFECEIVIYNVRDNIIEHRIFLNDIIDCYKLCGNKIIYNTIDESDYRSFIIW